MLPAKRLGIARLGLALGIAAFLLQGVLLLVLQPGAPGFQPPAAHHHEPGVPDEHDHTGGHASANADACLLRQALELAGHLLGGTVPVTAALAAERPATGWAAGLVATRTARLPVQPRAPPAVV